jgi:uncharacterized protein YjbI with pentapeptide repeats
LAGADLTHAVLDGVDLTSVHLSGAKLQHAYLDEAQRDVLRARRIPET